jgi:hypothetical protein
LVIPASLERLVFFVHFLLLLFFLFLFFFVFIFRDEDVFDADFDAKSEWWGLGYWGWGGRRELFFLFRRSSF